ncbi:MAG: sigma 54-interacting transcriptional regulator [Myxococcales bacterium]|nr:sigma 54-interacting transcriptional regulator [Myxococcales bacterium]
MAADGSELELCRSEARFRKIFEHSNDGIFVIDPSVGRILDVNDKACRILGFSRAELLQTSMAELHPHEAPQLAAFAEGVMQAGSGFTDTLSCRTKGGRFIAAEISASVFELEGEPCMIAAIRDVSDRVRLECENAYLKDAIEAELGGGPLLGKSAAMAKVREQISMVAATDANVLITGESGTGKELVAREIHAHSRRASHPLVKVNCASVPAELFESEFFGHAKGAFTGAVTARVGRFEVADGGTLLLDEVGEIPLLLQGKLLRVLQEQQFERVGESRTLSVDVRIIAATNRDLLAMSRDGRFREDLYYRLSVFPVHIPPLRDRPEDIAEIAERALAEACARHCGPKLSLGHQQLRLLEACSWPGNVRELQNVIDRGVIVGRGERLDLSALSPPEFEPPSPAREEPFEERLTLDDLKRIERRILERAMERSGGRIYGEGGAAQALGLKPTTLASKLKKLGIGRS